MKSRRRVNSTVGCLFLFVDMKLKSRTKNPLLKRARKGFRGYPVATIALYGRDDQRATKVAVGIVMREGAEPDYWNDGLSTMAMFALTTKSLDRFARSWPNMRFCLW